jgi:hypothetical protein
MTQLQIYLLPVVEHISCGSLWALIMKNLAFHCVEGWLFRLSFEQRNPLCWCWNCGPSVHILKQSHTASIGLLRFLDVLLKASAICHL